MMNNIKSLFSCIFEFFTCRKKPYNDEDDLLEYHIIYDK